jgi:hypothetical protein
LLRSSLAWPLLLVPLLLLATGRRRRAVPLLLLLLRCTRVTLTLTTFDRLSILSQNGPINGTGAFDLFRNWRLANDLSNRPGSKGSAAHSRHGVHFWTFINDDATACTIEIAIDSTHVVNNLGAIDDRRVIHNDSVRTDRLRETMRVDEDE